MLSIISFFSFNLEFTNVKKLRAVTFDEFLFITVYSSGTCSLKSLLP